MDTVESYAFNEGSIVQVNNHQLVFIGMFIGLSLLCFLVELFRITVAGEPWLGKMEMDFVVAYYLVFFISAGAVVVRLGDW